jgi:hypothetical protein
VVIELGGLIMDAVDHHDQAAERKRRRREELRAALRKKATLVADGAWRTWSAPAEEFQGWLQKREEQAALEEGAAGADIDALEVGITRLARIGLT